MARQAEHPESLTPAMRYALKLLSMRGRTAKEIAGALERKGFAADQGSVLEQLAQWGYLDDARYAKDRAVSLLRMGRFGTDGIVKRLAAAGISAPQARAAVEWARGEVGFDELQAAEAVLAKRGFTRLAWARDERLRGKAARLLRTRGFSPNSIERLLGSVDLDSSPSDD